MKIAIFGSYNGTSVGDTAILLGLMRATKLARPDAEISVLNMGPLDLSRDRTFAGLRDAPHLVRANAWAFEEWPLLSSLAWRAQCVLPYRSMLGPINEARCRSVLRAQDLLIIGGGNLLMDLFAGGVELIERICNVATQAALPYCFLGVGAGPIDGEAARSTFASCLAGARSVVVRDQASLALCRQALGRDDTSKAPDLAFALQGAFAFTANRATLAINVAAVGDRTWPTRNETRYKAYVDGIVRLARSAIELRKPERVEIVSTNEIVDRRAVADVLAGLNDAPAAGGPPATIATCRDVTDVLAAFSRAELALTTRLHAGILAAIAGCRVLPVAYDRKVASVLEAERITHRAVQLSEICDPDWDVRAAIDGVESLPKGLPRDIGAEVVATVRETLACAR